MNALPVPFYGQGHAHHRLASGQVLRSREAVSLWENPARRPGLALTCAPLAAGPQLKAPMPVMARPTMSVCMVSVPSKVWIASISTMCRMTW